MPAFAQRPRLWRPAAVQRQGGGGAFAVEAGALGLAAAGGRALPDALRGKMEAALGADFANVRVHVGPQAERIGAIAFTHGSDIYFAPGCYQPDTVHGQQLLGHELAHVVQQRAGRVKNPLGSGLAVVQDRALEAEADRLGQRAAAHRVAAQAKLIPIPGAVQRSAPAGISIRIAFGRNFAQSTRFHGRAMAIQAQLIFDSGPARWAADSSHCFLCMTGMSTGHRHHCRVCGQSVCENCSSQRFEVRMPQTSTGRGSGTSLERVCVDCILNKKIKIAKDRSPKFQELITMAKNPYVRWEAGCWPHHSPGRVTLNPTRGDVFSTFVFELTNAVAALTPLPKASTFASPLEYAYQIEYQEYLGSMWADEVAAEINTSQKDFQVEQRFLHNQPDQERFLIHLKQQHIGQHTEMYYEQWTKDKSQVAKAKGDWSAELDKARSQQEEARREQEREAKRRQAWNEAWSAHDKPGYTSFPALEDDD